MSKKVIPKSSMLVEKALKKINTGDQNHLEDNHEEKPKLPKAIFIFRRDLRVVDNTGLIACSKDYDVCPLFIFTPEQVDENPFKSSNAIQFMIESLLDLKFAVDKLGGNLSTFYGNYLDVLELLVRENEIKAIYLNKDYSPYSLKRDANIKALASRLKIDYREFDDLLLMGNLDAVSSEDGKKYNYFMHFHKRCQKLPKRHIDETEVTNWGQLKANTYTITNFKEFCLNNEFYQENDKIASRGGRKNALLRLDNFSKNWTHHKELRHFPGFEDGTSLLSAHNKFGTISIREVYWYFETTFGEESDLVRQLYWRDFNYYLAHHFPEIHKGTPIPAKMQYKNVEWSSDQSLFQRWCDGDTGFPLIDAGMRQMNATGHMHHRARLAVANFLTKDMLLNWKLGEKYFSTKLVDIDWCQNVGNWMWCAGTGADASPWLKIFNPHIQAKKVDPECIYIKKWIPELKSVPAKAILDWANEYKNHEKTGYPGPMLDHDKQKVLAMQAYKVSKFKGDSNNA